MDATEEPKAPPSGVNHEPIDLVKRRIEGQSWTTLAATSFAHDYVLAASETTDALAAYPPPFTDADQFRNVTMWRFETQIRDLQEIISGGDHNPQHYARLQTAITEQAKLIGAYTVTPGTGETVRVEFPGVDMARLAGIPNDPPL